ncbi:MCE family protein [Nocardioides jiangxiensis]|uniref:MlaD family protein n=1 Tax=Nocardioides jiangxiensis TaxID=3064524 RepID=A0ABT9AXH9_9ACTN|nr:MlaD family protein [Nocardioides sp. WY-20]MDO7867251.1 MlaD family protein [Nocardioides sp. WY-20]
MKSSWKEPRTVGVIGLLSLVLLGAIVVVLSSVSFGSREYRAELAQTAGLRVGEAVEVAGVEVGEVTALDLVDKHVEARFTVDRGVHIGSRSTASVRVATLMGTHYLAVAPAGSGEPADATIPLSRTSVPYNLQDVIDNGTDQFEALDTKALSGALAAVTQTLRASGTDLGPAARGVTRLSTMVTRQGAQYERLFGAARTVSDQLSASTTDLVTLMKASNLFLSELVRRRDKIHQLLLNVQHLSTTVSGIVSDNDATLGPLLRNLHTVNTVLLAREKELKKAIHQVAVSARYLDNASGNGPWFDLYIPDGTPDAVHCLTNGCPQ